jgi:hypothetical protein
MRLGQQHPFRAPQLVQRIAFEIVSSGVSISSRCRWASSCGSIMMPCRQLSQCSQARLPSFATIAKWACFQAPSNGDFDVTLGMLERWLDTNEHASSRVRKAIAAALRGKVPAATHKSLLRLANRGNATTLATTNFDLLFEEMNRRKRLGLQSYALGAIPRPSERPERSRGAALTIRA